jgi:hypothetical protein
MEVAIMETGEPLEYKSYKFADTTFGRLTMDKLMTKLASEGWSLTSQTGTKKHITVTMQRPKVVGDQLRATQKQRTNTFLRRFLGR